MTYLDIVVPYKTLIKTIEEPLLGFEPIYLLLSSSHLPFQAQVKYLCEQWR